ncbi:hypothetical protein Q0590_33925 [Rhodocytophaga aerolata]|uniref:Uncharacterized protein n=1 Tax=Rhodocytophaga aerolata TaxID=455078 RepID=A0ABT8RGU7_9BACT|nr:hypothetical protein [Rhodocytophaga aerolata]MDO1451323.1 hypothetical protein [Rhodocytophaga aerolata]
MHLSPIQSQPGFYPSKREVIIHLIELAILNDCFGQLICTSKPRYQINLVSESTILLLVGFEEQQLQAELFGFYRGLMEQTLAMDIEPEQTKLQAANVYEALLARKEILSGLYQQEQAMGSKCRFTGL